MTRTRPVTRTRARARACAAAAIFVAWASVALAAGDEGGRIVGSISPAGTVVRVVAVDRNVTVAITPKEVPVKEHPGTVLAGGASFEVRVPPGEYDLHFELADGRKLEGADLRTASPPAAKPLAAGDRDAIAARIMAMRTFENQKRVVEVSGSGTLARAIVELVRTNPTSYDGDFGEPVAIFRWELWEFKKQTGSWIKDRTVRILRRFLVARRLMYQTRWEFRGAWGGLTVADGATVTCDFVVPPAAASAPVTPAPGTP